MIGGLGFVSASAALAVTLPFEWLRGELVSVYRHDENVLRYEQDLMLMRQGWLRQ